MNDFASAPVAFAGYQSKTLLPVGIQEVEVTETMAGHWLDNCPYNGQRPLIRANVNKIKNDLVAAHFRKCLDAIGIGVVGRDAYLIGGRHRLTAIRETGIAATLTVDITEYGTMEQLAEVYAETNGSRPMTASDKAQSMGTIDFLQLSDRKRAKNYIAALNIIAMDMATSGSSKASELMRNSTNIDHALRLWSPQIQKYDSLYPGAARATQDKLSRAPVIAVGLVTLRYAFGKAFPFWEEVSKNDGLRRGKPAHTMNEFLSANTSPGSFGGKSEYVSKLANIFNAHYDERTLALVKPQKDPLTLRGTPYNGKNNMPDAMDILGIK